MTKNEEWKPVLDAEVERWSAMAWYEWVGELGDDHIDYEIEFNSKAYQVEVEMLENNEKYAHIIVAVDDGTMPASIRPLCRSIVRNKNQTIATIADA